MVCKVLGVDIGLGYRAAVRVFRVQGHQGVGSSGLRVWGHQGVGLPVPNPHPAGPHPTPPHQTAATTLTCKSATTTKIWCCMLASWAASPAAVAPAPKPVRLSVRHTS